MRSAAVPRCSSGRAAARSRRDCRGDAVAAAARATSSWPRSAASVEPVAARIATARRAARICDGRTESSPSAAASESSVAAAAKLVWPRAANERLAVVASEPAVTGSPASSESWAASSLALLTESTASARVDASRNRSRSACASGRRRSPTRASARYRASQQAAQSDSSAVSIAASSIRQPITSASMNLSRASSICASATAASSPSSAYRSRARSRSLRAAWTSPRSAKATPRL